MGLLNGYLARLCSTRSRGSSSARVITRAVTPKAGRDGLLDFVNLSTRAVGPRIHTCRGPAWGCDASYAQTRVYANETALTAAHWMTADRLPCITRPGRALACMLAEQNGIPYSGKVKLWLVIILMSSTIYRY